MQIYTDTPVCQFKHLHRALIYAISGAHIMASIALRIIAHISAKVIGAADTTASTTKRRPLMSAFIVLSFRYRHLSCHRGSEAARREYFRAAGRQAVHTA